MIYDFWNIYAFFPSYTQRFSEKKKNKKLVFHIINDHCSFNIFMLQKCLKA